MNRRRTRSEIAEQGRRSSPAALRNREPIAEVLKDWLPPSGTVLEVASGTGEHAVHFARRFPALQWQPSDQSSEAIRSIEAWRAEAQLSNFLDPIQLNASDPTWPVQSAEAVLCINMTHISPWSATLGLLEGSSRVLGSGAPLIFYGPWFADDVPAAPSNLDFNLQLRSRDSAWGVRKVEDLAAAASARGFKLTDRRAMPANNFMLLLRICDSR